MNKFVKGIIVGSAIGMAIGVLDYSCMPNMAKKYIRKGKRLLKQII